MQLARLLGATERQIQVWFQNRRQRAKRQVRFSNEVVGLGSQTASERPVLKRKEAESDSEDTAHAAASASATPMNMKYKRLEPLPQRRALSHDSAMSTGAFCAAGWDQREIFSQPLDMMGGVRNVRSYSIDCGTLGHDEDLDGLGGWLDGLDGFDDDSMPANVACSQPMFAAPISVQHPALPVVSSVGSQQRPVADYAMQPTHQQAAAIPCVPALPLTQPVTCELPQLSSDRGVTPTTTLPEILATPTTEEAHIQGVVQPSAPAAETRRMVLVNPQAPYTVLWASPGWLELCGFESYEVQGRTLESLLGGPLCDPQATQSALAAALSSAPLTYPCLVHHTKSGAPFAHSLRVDPLRGGDSRVPCIQLVFDNIIHLTEHLALINSSLRARLQGVLEQTEGKTNNVLRPVEPKELRREGQKSMLPQNLEEESSRGQAPALGSSFNRTPSSERTAASTGRSAAEGEQTAATWKPAPPPISEPSTWLLSQERDGNGLVGTMHQSMSELSLREFAELYEELC